ncbi:MAG: hypothetical protein Q8M94_19470 [Ignavibacteria bacterium]|nr:hypothetical protein [Ignavibacteria bacterium]
MDNNLLVKNIDEYSLLGDPILDFNPCLEREFGIGIIGVPLTKPFILLDHGVSIRGEDYHNIIQEQGYTISAVVGESCNGALTRIIPEGRILSSYTKDDFSFNEDSGLYTLTARDPFGEESTISFEKINNSYSTDFNICPHCHESPVAVLTNVNFGNKIYICPNILSQKSCTDFGLLVWITLFPNEFQLLTEDSCLGWCSSSLDSFSRNSGVLWKNKFYI